MRAGQLRHFVELQAPTISQSSSGSVTASWDTIANVYARIEPLQGKNLEIAKQIHNLADTQITIRYYPNINCEWRVKSGSRIYNIVDPRNSAERNIEIVLTCIEDKNTGSTVVAKSNIGIASVLAAEADVNQD